MRPVFLALVLVMLGPTAVAGGPHVRPHKDFFQAQMVHSYAGQHTPAGQAGVAVSGDHEVWVWTPVCSNRLNGNGGFVQVCASSGCVPGQQLVRLMRISPRPVVPGASRCVGPAVARALTHRPVLTPALVLRAFRRVPLPRLASIAQPGNKTLVNFDTIFHTQARPFTRTVTLLGQRVRLEITPSSYDWTWGDGTSMRTTTPGAAYPSREVVHRYQRAHVTVEHQVRVTWSAQYAVNGGPVQPVPGTVTLTGPATALRIAEATPALSGAGH